MTKKDYKAMVVAFADAIEDINWRKKGAKERLLGMLYSFQFMSRTLKKLNDQFQLEMWWTELLREIQLRPNANPSCIRANMKSESEKINSSWDYKNGTPTIPLTGEEYDVLQKIFGWQR